MTAETFRRADHRPVPTSDDEAEASCYFPLDIAHSPSRRRLSKEVVGREMGSPPHCLPKWGRTGEIQGHAGPRLSNR